MEKIINFDKVINSPIGNYNDIETYIKYEAQFVKLSDDLELDFTCSCGYYINKLYNFCPSCGKPILHISKDTRSEEVKSELIHKLIMRRNGY